MHGYVVPSRIGTLACTTLQLEFSVYSGKRNDVKKYVNNLEQINRDKKKKKKKKNTRSRPFTKVKQRWARVVLGWVTAWELRVLLAFFYFPNLYYFS